MPQILQRLVLPSFRGALSQHLPVVAVEGDAAGPCVVITANVHGDEATGIGVVHRLLTLLDPRLERGRVVLYPSLNLPGLVQSCRTLPADGQDLNRQFPGDPRGSASERHANAIWQDLTSRRPDAVIDLHADSPASIPYTLVDRAVGLLDPDAQRLEQRCADLAHASGLTVLHEYPRDEYRRYNLDRSLTGAVLNRLQVPAVTVEAGPRLYIAPTAVDVATEAVMAMLAALGMVSGAPPPRAPGVSGGPWRRQAGPRVSASGIFNSLVQPGDAFTRGQPLAEVRSLDGRSLETVYAERDGHVIALPERTWVTAGVSAGTYAVADRP